MSKKPLDLWYKEGLSFKCTGCGGCCSKEPGYVWLTREDIEKASAYLKISTEQFLKNYTRIVNGRISLLEHANYDCIFLKQNRCTIYLGRPKQCRQFPFWKQNLSSKEAWEEAAQSCEGINHKDAPLLTLKEIQDWQES